jgi:hypothetical protein
MNGLNRTLSAGVLLLASVAAHAVDDIYTFESISSIRYGNGGTVVLTGILAGAATPSTASPPTSGTVAAAQCAKYYEIMLQNQGTYTLSFTITTTTENTGPFPQTFIQVTDCHLALKP